MTYKKSIRKLRIRFQTRPSLKSPLKKSSGIKKRSGCKICIYPLRLSLWCTQTSKNAGYIKMIARNGPENQGSRRPGSTSKLTSKESLSKPKDHPGPRRPRGMQQMCNTHKPMRYCSPRFSRTTPWCWKILQHRHNPTEHWSRC